MAVPTGFKVILYFLQLLFTYFLLSCRCATYSSCCSSTSFSTSSCSSSSASSSTCSFRSSFSCFALVFTNFLSHCVAGHHHNLFPIEVRNLHFTYVYPSLFLPLYACLPLSLPLSAFLPLFLSVFLRHQGKQQIWFGRVERNCQMRK